MVTLKPLVSLSPQMPLPPLYGSLSQGLIFLPWFCDPLILRRLVK